MKKKNKIIVMIIIIVSMILFLSAGTLAYWYWSSIGDAKNLVVSIAGVRNSDINYTEGESLILGNFQPTGSFCESSSTTLSFSKKERIKDINLRATIHLDINSIGDNISSSNDVYWVVTSGENSITCEDGLDSSSVLSSGTFNGKRTGEVLDLLGNIPVSTSTQTFTVWIWIDSSGTDLESLSGQSLDVNVWTEIVMVYSVPNTPVLDDGMIPVTIANDGTVTVVSEYDPSWYNYDNKQWANVVLVQEDGAGETNSHARSYYQDPANVGETVTQEDILAYYVWVPRYKYRIPQIKCSDVGQNAFDNPIDYSRCYAPFDFETEKQREMFETYFINKYLENLNIEEGSEELMDFVSKQVEKFYETGFLYPEYNLGRQVDMYNWFVATDQETEIIDPEKEVTLISSEFNPDASLGENYEKSIDIVFEAADEAMKLGNAISKYRSHPAFWWDNDNDGVVDKNEMLSGIWVGKFASKHEKNSECSKLTYDDIWQDSTKLSLCNNSNQNPTILPDESKLMYQNVSNMFYTSRNISKEGNVYGLNNETINSHMMKNRDWGSVAYLSKSKYGINYVGYFDWPQEENQYGSSATYVHNTTGNITGIFDFFTTSSERVMASLSTEQTCDIYDYRGDCSGFEEMPQSKYYDSYLGGNFELGTYGYDFHAAEICTLDTCAGHALYEMVYDNWFGDIGLPWFGRIVDSTGLFFVGNYTGDSDSEGAYWRSVLVPGFGD